MHAEIAAQLAQRGEPWARIVAGGRDGHEALDAQTQPPERVGEIWHVGGRTSPLLRLEGEVHLDEHVRAGGVPGDRDAERLPIDRLPPRDLPGEAPHLVALETPQEVPADFGRGRGREGVRLGEELLGAVLPQVGHAERDGFGDLLGGHGLRGGDESDRVRYPIPRNVHIEGGPQATGDRHAILVDKSACRLYELYDLQHTTHGWTAGSGAVWSLRSNHLRPAGWTSADAAGLPIFPGLARWDEASRGVIDHALRFTAPHTRRAYIYPARHFASSSTDPALPPMGLRVRLKASVNVASFPRQARVVLRALQRYGMILADNGSPWYVSGAPNRHWNNDDLHSLGRLTGADFEVVDTSSLPQPK